MAQPGLKVRFTLVEMAIVVTIIALLAAIAVPVLRAQQLKARQAEVPPLYDAIMKADIVYYASVQLPDGGSYGSCYRPRAQNTDLNAVQVSWTPAFSPSWASAWALGGCDAVWDAMALGDPGAVYCEYMVNGMRQPTSDQMVVDVICDADDDNTLFSIRGIATQSSGAFSTTFIRTCMNDSTYAMSSRSAFQTNEGGFSVPAWNIGDNPSNGAYYIAGSGCY